MLVDFWAPWCGPCRMVAPMLERSAASYAGRVKVMKLNVDDNEKTAMAYQVQSIPTLLIFHNGRVVDGVIGAVPAKELERRLDGVLATDGQEHRSRSSYVLKPGRASQTPRPYALSSVFAARVTPLRVWVSATANPVESRRAHAGCMQQREEKVGGGRNCPHTRSSASRDVHGEEYRADEARPDPGSGDAA